MHYYMYRSIIVEWNGASLLCYVKERDGETGRDASMVQGDFPVEEVWNSGRERRREVETRSGERRKVNVDVDVEGDKERDLK